MCVSENVVSGESKPGKFFLSFFFLSPDKVVLTRFQNFPGPETLRDWRRIKFWGRKCTSPRPENSVEKFDPSEAKFWWISMKFKLWLYEEFPVTQGGTLGTREMLKIRKISKSIKSHEMIGKVVKSVCGCILGPKSIFLRVFELVEGSKCVVFALARGEHLKGGPLAVGKS